MSNIANFPGNITCHQLYGFTNEISEFFKPTNPNTTSLFAQTNIAEYLHEIYKLEPNQTQIAYSFIQSLFCTFCEKTLQNILASNPFANKDICIKN